MGFEVNGTFQGENAHVIWDEGQPLRGTRTAILEIMRMIREREEVDGTPTGPFYLAGLDPEELAVLTVCSIFEAGYQLLGAPPQYPPVEIPGRSIS